MEKRKSKSVAFNLDPQPMELSDASQPITIPSTTDPDVLQEIPIYFSRQLANKLSLLQYPVRPRAHPYTASHVPLEARLKPKSQVLELDIPLQPNATWYNRDRGRELALGLNDKEAKTIYDKDDWDFDDDDTSREHENLMHKQTLTATIIPAQANYMIGVMHNGMYLDAIFMVACTCGKKDCQAKCLYAYAISYPVPDRTITSDTSKHGLPASPRTKVSR